MESTALYWKPVWGALERYWQPICQKREGAGATSGILHLAQAQSNRGPRGRKKDFRDAERLVKRLVADELKLSFVPDWEQRLWRTLTRRRYQLTRARVQLQNQLEALLEEAHLKLSSLVSDLLGVSARRMLQAMADGETNPEALAGLADRRLRATPAQLSDSLGACTEAEHQIDLSYTWVKAALQGAGLVARAKKRGVHRRRRERRPLPGMLLHIDGSRHQWFQDERWYDLIVILDDATSEIYYAQLVEEESTFTVMAGWKEGIEGRGVFCALYSDRGSHFWLTPKTGGKVDPHRLTQVGRALRELGVQMIPAYSPQARGRSERNFGTWQGRLPQELRLRGIHSLEAANP